MAAKEALIKHLKCVDLTQSKQWLQPEQRQALAEIIIASFSNVDPEAYLFKYFDSSEPYQRKLRLYFDQERIVGYCLLTFTNISHKVVIKASAAFLPDYRKGSNTFIFSLQESFKSWLSKPWRKHYYADTMLSPAMYRAIAKNTGVIWPHFSHCAPEALFDHFNPNGDPSAENALRCLVSVDRVSNYNQAELDMLLTSDKPEIQYYCKLNPHFNSGVALFVIIPVNLKQFLLTILNRFAR
ncbi:hypothetical protein [Photobacterium sanguinicancri]|uniref:GNAT family N-acetyltransferase n=1 Tax=Photobacterium sanguinicancri TaxID=875932 RepID=A0ABX4FTW0_9GAMM|nr:hypothetical protein [Photobacterium sanguinicancri]OZS42307.1 hypothetical protein ASV53_19095 [Photobacterium sanguinicancri]